MKTFKVESYSNIESSDLTALLKQAICDHYDGMPVMRGLAFEEDSENRFWGETSSGIYCARVLSRAPDYAVLESLKEELLKFKNIFPEGLECFVFFPAGEKQRAVPELFEESSAVMFGGFKSVRFLGFHSLRAIDNKRYVAVEEFFCVEKKAEPIENPLPDFSLSFGAPDPYGEHAAEFLPGPATLTRQEIEEFFEIGLEIKRIRG